MGALYKRVSLFGRNTVSPSRPYASDRAARSGGQDWPKATAAGGCLDGREHGASLHEAGPCTERFATRDGRDNLLGPLARQSRGRVIDLCEGCQSSSAATQWPRGLAYLRERGDLGLAGCLTWEEVGLAVAVWRCRLFGVFPAGCGLRSEGPLMRMVIQWCCRRSSNASTSGFFWNKSYQAGVSKFVVMIVDVRR